MRPQKISDLKLLEELILVFRTRGYEGASLNDLAEASGLKKASLYHRFPGGKKEIGLAVLNFASEWKYKNITFIIEHQQLEPHEKLISILKNIKDLYQAGNCSCLMKAMSMGEGLSLFEVELKDGMKGWINSFEELGVCFGFRREIARRKATQALVKIQGSLIVSQNLKTTEPFITALKEIQTLFTES